MGTPGEQQPTSDATAAAVCGECGHSDSTVRDLDLKAPYLLCDPCFDDLVATRTASAVLPLSRVLDDVLAGTDPLEAGRRSDTWRRNAPAEPDPPAQQEDQPA
jgi:hypothetical protein